MSKPPSSYRFRAPLWAHQGPAPWYFLTVPPAVSDEIDEATQGRQGGWGSVRVEVCVGATTWQTSLFPSTQHGGYVLPVKRAVRVAEGLVEGAEVDVRVVTRDRPAPVD